MLCCIFVASDASSSIRSRRAARSSIVPHRTSPPQAARSDCTRATARPRARTSGAPARDIACFVAAELREIQLLLDFMPVLCTWYEDGQPDISYMHIGLVVTTAAHHQYPLSSPRLYWRLALESSQTHRCPVEVAWPTSYELWHISYVLIL